TSLHGIEGFLKDKIVEIDKDRFLQSKAARRLKSRPSSILGSCRFKLDEDISSPIYKEIFDKFKEYEISSFIYIGGNDSMDTVMKLNKYIYKNKIDWINIVGSPKTIDNDLMGMDHSPGFGSACKYIVNTLRDIRCDVDIYDKKTVTFVEIMGRNAGWLASSSLLANYGMEREVVNLVYLSENPVPKEDIIKDIENAHKYEDNLIVAVSEGFMDTNLNFKDEIYRSYDRGFNHPVISGVSRKLSEFVYQMMDIKTKAVEVNII
ncbi:6-phosphogluconate dehydrogenase, partial [Rhodovulum adriaticum]|nr:6-phosphogluconate dehydrogenase [Rhodovulum adriaticum]